jgi:tRNA(Ile)-lysidine synthase
LSVEARSAKVDGSASHAKAAILDLLSSVRRFVRDHDLIAPGTRVLAAVSGGSDSVALAHILRELERAGDLQLAGLVHFNHQLRAAADGDERFVAQLGASLGLPVFASRGDVAARARRERRSVEDAARTARHQWFEQARAQSGAEVVALGHTRDDQAETFLLRLVRGAGPRGLGGMHPRNGAIVRPLLSSRRAALREWLRARALPFVDDDTNADVAIPRNRVRAELVPLLEQRFNPAIVDVLADEAALARELWMWVDDLAAACAARLVRPVVGEGHHRVREIDVRELRELPMALRRAVLWRTMTDLAGFRPISFGHVDAAIRLTDQFDDDCVDLPGQRLERIGSRLVLRGRSADTIGRAAAAAPNLFRYPLSIPGEVALPQAGWRVSAELLAGSAHDTMGAIPGSRVPGSSLRDTALVRGDVVAGSLAVRNRRPGDRFRPVGLDGRKKLQDYFVDRKVARDRRDMVPIVVDETDRIVWVAGYEIDEAFRVTDPAQAVLILKLKALGGSA